MNDNKEKTKFMEHLEKVSKEVKEWPNWKKGEYINIDLRTKKYHNSKDYLSERNITMNTKFKLYN